MGKNHMDFLAKIAGVGISDSVPYCAGDTCVCGATCDAINFHIVNPLSNC